MELDPKGLEAAMTAYGLDVVVDGLEAAIAAYLAALACAQPLPECIMTATELDDIAIIKAVSALIDLNPDASATTKAETAIRAYLAAIGAGGQAVAVKPVDWRNGCASTSIGDYLVVEEDWDDEPFWFVMLNGKTLNKLGEHRDEASAIAAAQADYERRILSALSQPQPADERVVEALRAAYEKVKLWPEKRMPGVDVSTLGEGFTDLLALRNLIPDVLAALSAKEGR